ncbi:MAG: WGR domain-containing protein [Pseudomonadota bacterium]
MRIYMQTRPQPDQALRYYQLLLQEDLLGGWSLVRQWGPLGSRGTLRKEHFQSMDEAQAALIWQRDRQLGRGYQVMFIQGD